MNINDFKNAIIEGLDKVALESEQYEDKIKREITQFSPSKNEGTLLEFYAELLDTNHRNYFTITSKDTFSSFEHAKEGTTFIYTPLNDHSRGYMHKGDVVFCYRQGQFGSLEDALNIRGIYAMGFVLSDPMCIYPEKENHNQWGVAIILPIILTKHLELKNIQMHPNTISLTPYNGNRNDALQYIPDQKHYETLLSLIVSRNPELKKSIQCVLRTAVYTAQLPEIIWQTNHNYIRSDSNPLQQIYYGAPGTGKSHKVNKIISAHPKENVFLTTFHPDSDYSTFVGCYKPTKEVVRLRDVTGKTIKENVGGVEIDVTENRITYEFVPQIFTQAYVRAYETKDPVFLVIEEINRGNCAQIFGDIFQLLDRDDEGWSNYAIKPDGDLDKYFIDHMEDYNPKEGMRIPPNLHILATMNTSDQSLFPIDSAFKRRWDWEYVPIENHEEVGYWIEVGDKKYDWGKFLENMNKRIYKATSSEDKEMGYFFVKLKKDEKKISEDVMVNKVLFYLFNDVFKDFDSEGLFKVDNKLMHFSDYHDKNNRSMLLKDLMSKLSLEPTNAESTQQAKQDNLDNTQN